MNLKIEDKLFVVGGAGAGFGRAIATALAQEGAKVIAVSRTGGKLQSLRSEKPDSILALTGDITKVEVQGRILELIGNDKLSGVLVNAGGPPAGGFFDLDMDDWENAWKTVVRWKISFVKKLLPLFLKNNYGRIVFVESVSVKQQVPNLILSNALRPAIVGMAKTLSREVAGKGININVLAPGYHETSAMKRLYKNTAKNMNISEEEAKLIFEKNLPVKPMGRPEEMASLALWLLSPLSRYVTGQTISHDGGLVEGLFG
ncbi:MAG: SDR family oxidoreductase [Chlorobi bacterium]|nr:SDR family oxidoreductase [Chlorobiota bacterium]